MNYKPGELSKKNISELKEIAAGIRGEIIASVEEEGGHLSSNLGAIDLTISLLRYFDPLKDDLIFDVGHQTYAYKLLTGRSISSKEKGYAPFSSKSHSEYDKYESGHAGDALSIALGIAKAKRLKGDTSYTIAIIGDGAMADGLTFEALNLILKEKDLKNFVVLLNDNGMAISPQVGYIENTFKKQRNSMIRFRTTSKFGKKLNSCDALWKAHVSARYLRCALRNATAENNIFKSFGLKYIGPFDGNDFISLDLAMKKALKYSDKGPVFLHLFTEKGSGYDRAKEDREGYYHSIRAHSIEGRKENLNPFDKTKLDYLREYFSTNANAYLISPATQYGAKLTPLFKEYPDRCEDVGIAEEHSVTLASGLSLKGILPIVDIRSTFLQRGYDEIIEDAVRNRGKIRFLVERAGLVERFGPSHHGIYDVSFLKTIPGTKVYMPFDERSLLDILYETEKEEGCSFIRIPDYHPSSKLELIKEGCFYKKTGKNSEHLVISVGPLGHSLLSETDSDGVLLTELLPEDEDLDRLDLSGYVAIDLYDPYSTFEGLASAIESYLLRRRYKGVYRRFTLDKDFYPCGTVAEILDQCGLSVDKVLKKIGEVEQREG